MIRFLNWVTNNRRMVKMFPAYVLWFLLGGLGVHLAYTRRWVMLVFHYGVALLLALGWWVSHRGDYSSLFDNEYMSWLAILGFEGVVLAHQVVDTNLRARSYRVPGYAASSGQQTG